jgi:phosphoribosylformylglycinamidine synthase PurS subunit
VGRRTGISSIYVYTLRGDSGCEVGAVRVKVFVSPRKGILDPQGRAVEHSLQSLGFKGVSDVKIGKYIVFDIEAKTPADAREQAKKICERLLANPLIEDYTLEVEGE